MTNSKIAILIRVTLVAMFLPLQVSAQYTNIYHFNYANGDGLHPYGSFIVSDDILYGMTAYGNGFSGSVFKMDLSGNQTILHRFVGTDSNSSDGANPVGDLSEYDSMLYGTTRRGGKNSSGIIFKMHKDGSGFSIIHNFYIEYGHVDNAYEPCGSILKIGNRLYGMASGGNAFYKGVVFGVDINGTSYTNLHHFSGAPNDGSGPGLGMNLALTTDGVRLFGLTCYGGTYNKGIVFSMNTDGSDYSILHHFEGGPADGSMPTGSMLLIDSTLYGMTRNGGTFDLGTIFKLGSAGTDYSIIHSFAGGPGDGARPLSSSLTVCAGKIFGMVPFNNMNDQGFGSVFMLNKDGTEYNIIYNFKGYSLGSTPYGSLLKVGNSFFGMTSAGGSDGRGTVFSLVIPQIATSAIIWNAVEIGWQSEAGTSYQVQCCTNLAMDSWENYGTVVIGNGSTNTVFDSTRSQNRKFYRIQRIE